MLVNEDRLATQLRFVERVNKFNAHHCPTIRDFKPHIDNLLTSLEERKNAIIEKRNGTIAEQKAVIEQRDKTIQQWEQTYSSIEYIINGFSAPDLRPFEE